MANWKEGGPSIPDILLRSGVASAAVCPADGGRLGALSFGRGSLIRGRNDGTAGWAQWGCYPLVPWSNRIPAGRFTFEGTTYQLPVNWPDGSAIHGLVANVAWTVESATHDSVDLIVTAGAGPYLVSCHQRVRLLTDRLLLRLSVESLAAVPLPFGLGIHPWFRRGVVQVAADRVWPSRNALPTGPPEAVAGDWDLRRGRVPVALDDCFTDLFERSARVPGAVLSWSGPVSQVVVYSADPSWTCVEPVTMANDGFRLLEEGLPGHGVAVLAPGESMAVDYVIADAGAGAGAGTSSG